MLKCSPFGHSTPGPAFYSKWPRCGRIQHIPSCWWEGPESGTRPDGRKPEAQRVESAVKFMGRGQPASQPFSCILLAPDIFSWNSLGQVREGAWTLATLLKSAYECPGCVCVCVCLMQRISTALNERRRVSLSMCLNDAWVICVTHTRTALFTTRFQPRSPHAHQLEYCCRAAS